MVLGVYPFTLMFYISHFGLLFKFPMLLLWEYLVLLVNILSGREKGNNKLLRFKIIKILFIYILVNTLFPLSNNYIIDFYGIDVMRVSDSTRDTLLFDSNLKVNSYVTQTKGLFDIIFPTKNTYTTYYNEDYVPIKYTKDINQFGNVNYRIDINDIKGNVPINGLDLTKSLNMFSLLDYIEDNLPNIENEKIIIQGGAQCS